MTFFVCFNLLLGFLIKYFFIVYVKGSINNDGSEAAGNSSQKRSSESNANQQTAPQHILDLQEEHDRMHKQRKEDLANWKSNQELLDKEKKSKQDSSDIVNDGSEPTPLTDLDGGD